MALIALVAAVLSAQPPRLVLGADAGAELALDARALSQVHLTSSVGRITGGKHEGGGLYRAHFVAPELRAPAVALLLAEVDEGGERSLSWLALPLAGSDTLELQTKHGARVVVDIGGQRFGPVTADKRGNVKVPIVVAPGVTRATVRTTDKRGNEAAHEVDLDPPPFTRVRIASRSAQVEAGAPFEVEVFVVKPDGTPDDEHAPRVSAAASPAESLGHGVWLARVTAPRKTGPLRLEARTADQLAVAETEVVAAAPREPSQALWQSTLLEQQPWSFSLGALVGGGASFTAGGALAASVEAALRLADLPVEAIGELGLGTYGSVQQGTDQLKPSSTFVQLGVRGGLQLSRNLDGHAAVLLGLLDQTTSTRLQSGSSVDVSATVPRAELALGLNLRVGPGRALAQLQFDSSPSGEARLSGSLSGIQVTAGYLVTLR